jgi:hypothetical protein
MKKVLSAKKKIIEPVCSTAVTGGSKVQIHANRSIIND